MGDSSAARIAAGTSAIAGAIGARRTPTRLLSATSIWICSRPQGMAIRISGQWRAGGVSPLLSESIRYQSRQQGADAPRSPDKTILILPLAIDPGDLALFG